MKGQIFTLSFFLILTSAYSQKNIRLAISGEQGVTKHFTTLNKDLQVTFNPSKARSIFGLDANSDLILLNTEADGNTGMTHYRYYQTYKGLPVENAMYIAHTLQGKLISLSGSVVTDFASQMSRRYSSLSEKQAIKDALNYVQAEKYAWQDADFEQRIKFRQGSNASYYPRVTKAWYSGDEEINPLNLKLAYKVDVYSLKPLDRKFVYIDAQSGEILGTSQVLKHADAAGTAATGYSGLHTIHSDYTGTYYRLRDYTKGKGIITLHASGSHADYKSSSSNFKYFNADKWALDAHYGVAATWKFYKRNFNRNSIDNNGFALISWVNDAHNTDNAYWDGSEMDFGNLSSNGKGVVAIDVIGHELTHGVTQWTSGLAYSKEPGAINESMSDIMGKSIQFYTKPSDSSWVLSNDMGWEIRSFSNPNANQQPDTYKGDYWATGSSDNYGVHTNSGVGNYMFYLLVKGGSGTNDIGNKYSVKGIGLSKADQILYRTNTAYLTSTSQYADWYVACIQAATDLYGEDSNEVKQVKNAWYAVGIGSGNTSSGSISYCASSGANSTFEYINKVVLGSVSNTSGNNNGYKDFTGLSTDLIVGKTYKITLTPGFTSSSYLENWTVFIDYNKDGILNGSGEIVATGNGTAAQTLSFTVPSNAKTGSTRMRIQMGFGSLLTDPCATVSFGEVEDYTVKIGTGVTSAGLASLIKDNENTMTIRPNPVTGQDALISYQLAADGRATVSVMDINGRLYQNADLGYQKAGEHTYLLSNFSPLAAGNYIILLRQNNKIIERKHLMIAK